MEIEPKARLAYAQTRQLEDWVKEHYVALNLPDQGASEKATEALGFKINRQHVLKMRQYLRIEPNGRKMKYREESADAGTILALETRLAFVESQLETLRLWLKETFPTKGPRL